MRTRAVRPRWAWPFMRSTACWSWDARAMSASPEPGREWGDCVHTPDRCTMLAHGLEVGQGREGRADRGRAEADRPVEAGTIRLVRGGAGVRGQEQPAG